MYGLERKVKRKGWRAIISLRELLPSRREGTLLAQAGPQRKFQLEKWRRGNRILQVNIVQIASLGNTPRQQRKLQRFPAERIGIQRELISTHRAQLPIRLIPAIVSRHTLDRRVQVRPEAKMQRQPVQSVQPLRVQLDQI